MAAANQSHFACATFRPPPGLTEDDHQDVAFPPGLQLPVAPAWQGNYTHQVPATIPMEEWSLERTRHQLNILAALSLSTMNLPAPLKVYPSRPPGNFDSASSASTAASEIGEDNDETPELFSPIRLPESLLPKEETRKELPRELQVDALDMALARALQVQWPVDSKKLRGRDKQVVSPSFEIFPGCSFKLMLKPKVMGDKKHQEGFQRARGWGSVELKCVEGASVAPALKFWISVGDGSPRGPVTHDFGETTVAGLAKGEESFHFASEVDEKSSMFLVSLQAFPIDSSEC